MQCSTLISLCCAANCTAKELMMTVPGGQGKVNGSVTVTFTKPGVFYVICPVGELSPRALLFKQLAHGLI